MSAPTVLLLTSLRVRRTPGIVDAFELALLSERINVVYGPNASGKTSTARAIEAVLWPEARTDARLSLTAEYRLGTSRYRADVDAGHATLQRDGADAPPLTLPAPELRHRYRLSLHDLIAHEGTDFAAEIARQSVGGYDIPGAARGLGFRERPSAAQGESRALEQAKAKLKAAQAPQAKLRDDARALDDLERRREEARRARERSEVLTLALKHAHAAIVAEGTERALAELPAELERLRGDEHDRLRAARARLREADEQTRARTGELDAAQRMTQSLFPHGPPSGDMLPALREAHVALQGHERDVESATHRLAAAAAEEAEARRVLGAELTDERLAAIDATAVGELSAFAREAERLRAEQGAADAELRWAGDEQAPTDLDTLRAGIRLLAQWLAGGTGDDQREARAVIYLWTIALSAAGAWAAFQLRGWDWAFTVVAIGAAVLAGFGVQRTSKTTARAAREQEYARMELPLPEPWAVDSVRVLLDTLQKRLATGQLAQERASWRAQAIRRRDELALRVRALDARRTQLVARFGVAPDTDERTLSWLADRIGRWQDAARAAAGARAALESARAQHGDALAVIARRLDTYGYAELASAAEVAGALDDLERRLHEYELAMGRRLDLRRRLEELERARQRDLAECAEILERAGASDDAAVDALCARYEEYVAARDAHRLAARDRTVARAELEASGAESALFVRSVAAIESELDDAKRLAAELVSLTEQVMRLRAEIDRAKHTGDVEAALAEVSAAERALHAARERDLHAMLGNLVVQHVQRVTRDQHRPAVFHRARELFAQITRGRYRLDFDDGDAPQFRAFDTATGLGHDLNQLSSGTRVQLLLAVRVAFVESQEPEFRLPLLLDETLGTSDDVRAQAIIDAVITLAEGGRQVFYFTAQRDEVGKWMAALEARGAPHALIDLAAARKQRPIDDGDLVPIAPVLLALLPEPDGSTHDDYGARLGVPAVRPGVDEVGSTPLWYVVDEVPALYELLRVGIETWGALRTLAECGGGGVLDLQSRTWPRAQGFARAVEALHAQAKIGRGRPVDRTALIVSGVLSSERQLEKIIELAVHCEHRAKPLLEALERREVSHVREHTIAELREFFERNGYLDERPPRTPDQIRAAMLAAASAEIEAGTLTPDDIHALARRIEERARGVRPQGSGIGNDLGGELSTGRARGSVPLQ